ncbi:thioredoxin domain-containing protein 6 [Perognathus longimembris pacificus]|uniref:thioredoxin domain-containing protein 6 n=1 Tax=Perognathus longimembris pacificus TaxID=214514 RepID=UPI0020189D56|nr:thioredoxin domain-containing protein 6 [Perognathus longimembris pacificus]
MSAWLPRRALPPLAEARRGRGSRRAAARRCQGNRRPAAALIGYLREGRAGPPFPPGRFEGRFGGSAQGSAMGSKKKELALQVGFRFRGCCGLAALGVRLGGRRGGEEQVHISTPELWEEVLSAKGLTVVDVHQGWCGPCKPMLGLFQKMSMEVGLDLLHFALAEADRLDVLEQYRGRCEPTFLFYAGGELVAVVRGANAPLLQKTILEQLEAEKRVLAGGGERKAIKDEALPDEDEWLPQGEAGGEEDVVSVEQTCTLAIIKPDAVGHGKADEIVMKILEAGFDIVANEERVLTETEMRLFYHRRAGEEAFETLVQHMCSGPSRLLILTGAEAAQDVVGAWRGLVGPRDPDVARREQPESLRAQYGTEMPFNAVHGSWDREDAGRELALLFPNFKFPDKEDTEALRGAEPPAAGPEDVDGDPGPLPQACE